ncbi:MAG TPA: hypothetical protein VGJ34_00780 [Gaiellaceae bacterium]|jgi:hypothetical protein
MAYRRDSFDRDPPHPGALLLAAPPLIFSVVGLLVSFVLYGLRCDEACDGDSWRRSADAWQWDLVLILGGSAFVAALAFVVCVWRIRPRGALAALLVGTGAFMVDLWWVEPDWAEHIARHQGIVLLGVAAFLSGVVSVAVIYRDAR